MSPLELFLIWLLVINLLTVVIYRYDKRVAGSGRSRIPESRLLLLALAGGSPGAYLAMFHIRPRHKSQKFSFLWKFGLIVLLQIAGLVYWQLAQRP